MPKLCWSLDCMCDCELDHKKCRIAMCDWRKEKLLKLEKDVNNASETPKKPYLTRADVEDIIGMPIPCKPDCTDIEHAYHQGSWDTVVEQEDRLRNFFGEVN